MPMRPHPYQDRTENAGNHSHEEASTDTDPERHLARLPDLRTQCGWHREGAFGGRFLHTALDRGDSFVGAPHQHVVHANTRDPVDVQVANRGRRS